MSDSIVVVGDTDVLGKWIEHMGGHRFITDTGLPISVEGDLTLLEAEASLDIECGQSCKGSSEWMTGYENGCVHIGLSELCGNLDD